MIMNLIGPISPKICPELRVRNFLCIICLISVRARACVSFIRVVINFRSTALDDWFNTWRICYFILQVFHSPSSILCNPEFFFKSIVFLFNRTFLN